MRLLLEAWNQNSVPQWALAGLLAFVSLLLMVAHAVAERVIRLISDQGRTAPLRVVQINAAAAPREPGQASSRGERTWTADAIA